jgi:hypothetical protein
MTHARFREDRPGARSPLARTAIAIVALAAMSRGALAASFTAQLNASSVEEGEGVTLTLTLQGADAVSRPFLSLPEGVYAAGAPRTSTMHRFDGQTMVSSQEYSYTLGFSKTGTFAIGPARIGTTRGELSSATVAVAVRKAGATKDVLIFARLEPSRAYVGQPVVATLEVAFARRTSGYSIKAPLLGEVTGARTDDPENLAQKWAESVRRARRGLPGYEVIELSEPQTPVVAAVSNRAIDSVPYTVYTVRRVLIPSQAGQIEFAPARVVAEIVTGATRGRAPLFDDPFFGPSLFSRQQLVTRTVTAYSDSLILNVVEMPAEGRPAGFDGAIGRYELTASAGTTAVMLGGSPIQLTLTVRGEGNLETVGVPKLVDESGFRAGTPEQSQEMQFAAGKLTGVKRFTIPLRPRSPNVSQIPATRLVVFDPDAGTYTVLSSPPIPISVTAPENTGAVASVEVPADPALSLAAAKPQVQDIEDIETERDPVESHAARLHDPGGIVAFFVAPLAVFAALAFYAARLRRLRDDVGLARRLSALSTAARKFEELRSAAGGLDPIAFADRLSRVCQTYLADVFARPTGEISAREAGELLAARRVRKETVDRVVAILSSAEAARFGGADLDPVEWLGRVEECIRSLDEDLR